MEHVHGEFKTTMCILIKFKLGAFLGYLIKY